MITTRERTDYAIPDGVMVEVHPSPDDALSDAEQQLTLDQFRDMMAAITPLHALISGVYAADRSAAQ